MKKNTSFFIITTIFITNITFSNELIVPTPELPTTYDPIKSLDVYSNSAIRQIHKSLFKLNSSGEPIPDLVKNFEISSDGLIYTFTLTDSYFSNSKKLHSLHIVNSLQRAIRNKVNGFQKLSCINGYSNFVSKKNIALDGVKIINDSVVSIFLNCKINRFPYLLADLRYAIIYSNSQPSVGLGDYKVAQTPEKSPREIILESVDKNATFKKITYIKATTEDAINLLLDSTKNVFLFSYKINQKNKERLLDKANIFEMRSWTNYFLALNSARNPYSHDRENIISSVDKETLIQNCYNDESTDDNIFPYGFPGYVKNFKKNKKKKSILQKKITITVFNGVGNEDCLKNNLSTQLGKNVKIEIVSTEQGIEKWIKNKTDAIIFFLESELSLDVSQFFALDAEFFLGRKNDKKTLDLVKILFSSENPTVFRNTAIKLQNRVLDQNLLLPLFIPKTQIFSSRKIRIPDLGMIPPTYLTFKNLKLKNGLNND